MFDSRAVTEHPVGVFQRIDQAGFKLLIDDRILADTDTLLVFGLDHLLSEQEAAPEEVLEYCHHGDRLLPRQQRFGQYTRR
jgi:hypothetical protein